MKPHEYPPWTAAEDRKILAALAARPPGQFAKTFRYADFPGRTAGAVRTRAYNLRRTPA